MKVRPLGTITSVLLIAAGFGIYGACGRSPETGVSALLTQLGDSTDVLSRALDDRDAAVSRATTYLERLDAEVAHERLVRREARELAGTLHAIQGCTSESELAALVGLGELTGEIEQTAKQHLHAVVAVESAPDADLLEDTYQGDARRLVAETDRQIELAREQAEAARLTERACSQPRPFAEPRPSSRPDS
jgi:hypothetical protein